MAGRRPALKPEAGSRGLSSADPAEALAIVRAAYGGAAQLARTLDLEAPSRLPGWTRRDVLVHLGAWEEHPVFARLLDDARHGRVHDVDDADARNAMLVAAHQDAGAADVAGALEAAADRAAAFLTSTEAETLGRRFTDSTVGPLPVTGMIVASAYEVAVHALDIATPDQIPAALLEAGVAGLVDVTGALAARRGVTTTFAVRTPSGTWAFGSAGADWTTLHLDAASSDGQPGWPGLDGTAADILEAASGRGNATALVLSRRLRLHDVAGLLALVPALEAVPGLPGGSAARATLRTLSQTARLVAQVGRRGRGTA